MSRAVPRGGPVPSGPRAGTWPGVRDEERHVPGTGRTTGAVTMRPAYGPAGGDDQDERGSAELPGAARATGAAGPQRPRARNGAQGGQAPQGYDPPDTQPGTGPGPGGAPGPQSRRPRRGPGYRPGRGGQGYGHQPTQAVRYRPRGGPAYARADGDPPATTATQGNGAPQRNGAPRGYNGYEGDPPRLRRRPPRSAGPAAARGTCGYEDPQRYGAAAGTTHATRGTTTRRPYQQPYGYQADAGPGGTGSRWPRHLGGPGVPAAWRPRRPAGRSRPDGRRAGAAEGPRSAGPARSSGCRSVRVVARAARRVPDLGDVLDRPGGLQEQRPGPRRQPRRMGPRPLPRPGRHVRRVAVLQPAQGRRQAVLLARRPRGASRSPRPSRKGKPRASCPTSRPR